MSAQWALRGMDKVERSFFFYPPVNLVSIFSLSNYISVRPVICEGLVFWCSIYLVCKTQV